MEFDQNCDHAPLRFAKGQRPSSLDHHFYSVTTAGISTYTSMPKFDRSRSILIFFCSIFFSFSVFHCLLSLYGVHKFPELTCFFLKITLDSYISVYNRTEVLF